MMGAAVGLALANSLVLIGLIYLYARIAMKTRATYSVGLAVFAGLLLLHNLLTVFAYATMAPLFGTDALPFLSGIGALEFGGLLVLLKLTL
jgi:uncharacterized membrane protein